ncbi:MAG: DUF2141 domain-containing protein [Myxococcota bacterium]
MFRNTNPFNGALLFLVAGLAAAPAAAAEDAPAWELVVEIRGVESARGDDIYCSLFGSEQGFPMDSSKALETTKAKGKGAIRTCTFSVPKAGSYAVSVLHDENANRKVDTKIFGIPTEGWATSNNVKPRFRAPNFEESRFEITTAALKQRVDMHY